MVLLAAATTASIIAALWYIMIIVIVLIVIALIIGGVFLIVKLAVRAMKKKNESFTGDLKLSGVDIKDFKLAIQTMDTNIGDGLSRWNEYVYQNEMNPKLVMDKMDMKKILDYLKTTIFVLNRAVKMGLVSGYELQHNYPQTLNIAFSRYQYDINELHDKAYGALSEMQRFVAIDIMGLYTLKEDKTCCESHIGAKIDCITKGICGRH